MRPLDCAILAFCRVWPSGLSPRAPGTCGTAEALVFAPFLFFPLGLVGRVFLLLLVFVAGGLAATRAEQLLGRKDPGEVVIDELAGVWLAVLPFATWSLPLLACAFVIFRFFDILKPWPIHASEDWLPGGWGIMIDDIIGGAMTLVCLLVLRALGVLSLPLCGLCG